METPKLDIDDIILHKLSADQVKVAFLLAYGKYKNQHIAEYCGIGVSTIYQWQRDENVAIAIRHFKLIELYHNLKEFTELKKAAIFSATAMFDAGLNLEDPSTFEKGLDQLDAILKSIGNIPQFNPQGKKKKNTKRRKIIK